jgi:hypothetical protein
MSLERDYDAERLARIDALLSDAKHALATPLDRKDRQDLCTRLDATLKEMNTFTPFSWSSHRAGNEGILTGRPHLSATRRS